MNPRIIAFDVCATLLGVVVPLFLLAWTAYRVIHDRDAGHRPRAASTPPVPRWYDIFRTFFLLPLGLAVWTSWFRIVSPLFPSAFETGHYYIFLVPAIGYLIGYPWFEYLRRQFLFPATDTEPGQQILREANRRVAVYVLVASLGTLLVGVLSHQLIPPEA